MNEELRKRAIEGGIQWFFSVMIGLGYQHLVATGPEKARIAEDAEKLIRDRAVWRTGKAG